MLIVYVGVCVYIQKSNMFLGSDLSLSLTNTDENMFPKIILYKLDDADCPPANACIINQPNENIYNTTKSNAVMYVPQKNDA